ncbi:TBC1_domain_family_member_20/GTPase [Leishmania braziliensis MHOM/BR/75/M2904]|nr:TBC1_domain_family_member_20/GTPase [Leishmania braziliensis MHOM/BR/75/M2904]
MSTSSTASSISSSLKDEELLIDSLERRRLEQTEAEYIGYCTMLCRSGRLKRHGKLRAMVWRDVVMGCKAVAAVPQLSDGIIRQLQEETRLQANQGGDSHSRENTHMSDSMDSFISPMAEMEDDNVDGKGSPSGASEVKRDKDDDVNNDSSLPRSSASVGTDQALSPVLASSRRHRHPSLSPPRPMPSAEQMEEAADGFGRTGGESPLVLAQVRRRAVSQLSRRVKSDAVHFLELTKDGVSSHNVTPAQNLSGSVLWPISWYHLPDNCQPRVVEADVERSLWTLYPHSAERNEQRRRLKNTILRVLLHNPERFYYQGLHELMGYMMYVLSPYMEREEVVSVCERLLVTRWKRFSAHQLRNSEAMLYATHAIIAQVDPPLATALEWCRVGPESHYAVSWVITWYVHNIENLEVLARLFDYLMVDVEGSAVIYFTAALVISQREIIFEWIHDAKEAMGISMFPTEVSDDGIMLMARVYAQLSRLPSSVLNSIDEDTLNTLVEQAEQYCTQHRHTAQQEEQNFLNGDVKNLGLLSNQRTRNAALRLLWHFLPREWRSPAKSVRVRRVLWTSLMVAAAAMVVATATVDLKPGRWIHDLLHR